METIQVYIFGLQPLLLMVLLLYCPWCRKVVLVGVLSFVVFVVVIVYDGVLTVVLVAVIVVFGICSADCVTSPGSGCN